MTSFGRRSPPKSVRSPFLRSERFDVLEGDARMSLTHTDGVRGFVIDVATGKLHEVTA